MTPEQEAKLYELIEHVVETKTMVAGMRDSFAAHEKNDAETHAAMNDDIGALKEERTKLKAYYAILAVFVAPAAWWIISLLMKGSAHAQ